MSDSMNIAQVAATLKERMARERHAPRGTYRTDLNDHCTPGCEVCGGSGWVRWDRERSDPYFGRLEPCPLRPQEARHVSMPCGLYLDEMDNLDWANIKPSGLDKLTVKMGDRQLDITPKTTSRVADGIRKYLTEQGWGLVYIYAPYGNAKTLLLKTAIAAAVGAGQDAVYTNLLDVLDNIRDAFDLKDPRESAQRRMDRWQIVPVLAVDEFEKFPGTDWEQQRVFQLIDRRHSAAISMRNCITIIAANERPEKVDKAIASRVHDGRNLYIEMIGKDARPGMTAADRF